MDKLIKLMPDYGVSPVWEFAGGDLIDNADPEYLPLTADLRAALRRWASAYDATLNQEYPPDSGFLSPADEDAFEAEGLRLWKELQAQLGAEYTVAYFSQRDGRLYEPESTSGSRARSENGPGLAPRHDPERARSGGDFLE